MDTKTLPDARTTTVVWLFSLIGDATSLLYWDAILRCVVKRFPRSRFFSLRPPTKQISGTSYQVECVGSWRIPLGARHDSYDRQIVVAPLSLVGRIRREQPDVIVVKELVGSALLVALFRRWLAPAAILVLIESDPYRGKGRQMSWFARQVRKWICRRVDLFMACNAEGRDYLGRELNVDPAKVLVRPFLVSEQPGPSPASDDTAGTIRDDLPRRPDQKTVFLTVGQLIPRKGVHCLLRAVAGLAPPQREKAEFWLVGDGPSRQDLESLADDLGLRNEIKFWGRQPFTRIGAFYGRADVFVMPTLDDYRALVGFEAIAHGLAILHSVRDGACREVVDDGDNGFLIDPYQTEEFTQRLAWIVDHPDEWQVMGRRSRERSARFTVSAAADALEQAVLHCVVKHTAT